MRHHREGRSMTSAPRPPYPPVEPPPATAAFPDPRRLGRGNEVAAVSRTLSPALVLAAYRRGIFPWPISQGVIPWVSPDPRALFPLESPPHWSRSLTRTLRRGAYSVTFDRAFRDVIVACGQGRSDGT